MDELNRLIRLKNNCEYYLEKSESESNKLYYERKYNKLVKQICCLCEHNIVTDHVEHSSGEYMVEVRYCSICEFDESIIKENKK